MRLSYFLLLIIFILPLWVSGQQKYSNDFLNLGVGSRAFGMSQAVTASARDVTAGYWNPAGLARMDGNIQAALMHSEYFAGIAKYDYAGFAASVADNTAVAAVSLIRFGVDDIPDTSQLIDADGNINYDRVKSFSAADYALILSYARRKGKDSRNISADGLFYGANVKIIHRKVGEYGKSYGFGLDAGLQYIKGNWTFAAAGRDISTTYNSWSYNTDKLNTVYTETGNEIPKQRTEITYPKFILGTAYTYSKANISLTAETNLILSTDGRRNVLFSGDPLSADPVFGLETGYKDIVFLRGGLGNIQKTTDFDGNKYTSMQPNMGIGIKIDNVSFDYALTDIGNVSDALYSNVFSIRMEFGK